MILSKSFYLTDVIDRVTIDTSKEIEVIDMIDITYLDGAKQERVMHFDSYDEFERSQQACLIGVADFYPVVKLTYNGHELDYQGTYGDVFFYLMKQDLTQYQN